jgi:peptidoglycan/LPS O-acetylase OafA/YrhL
MEPVGAGTDTVPGQRIDELESLRGVAAMLVVFYHMPKWNPILEITLFRNGYLMVPLFFVMSGFVITAAYRRRIDSLVALARFQFLRFGRLYPIHILFLFAFVLIEFAKYLAQTYLGLYSNLPPFEPNGLDAFVKNLLLISAVLPNQPTTFNYPAWSISVEFYTYLVFGAILLRFRRASDLVFLAFAAVSLVAIATGATFGFHDLLSCFLGFFLGCLTERLVRRNPVALPGYVVDLLVLAIVLFLSFKTDKRWDVALYFASAALVYALVHARDGLARSALRHPWLIALGTLSYSLYMSHAAIQWVVAQVVRVVLHRPQVIDERGTLVPALSATEATIATTVVIVLVIAVSIVTYRYVEMPMRERSRRIAKQIGRPVQAA